MPDHTGALRALAAACAVSFLLATPGLAAPPVEAFAHLPTISDARLSPDGKHLALIGPAGGRNAVTVFTLDNPNAKPMRAGFPDADAIGIRWANNNRLICIFKSNIKRAGQDAIDAFVRAISVAMDGGKAAVLMHDAPFMADVASNADANAARIVDQDPADPNHVYMVAFESDSQMSDGGAKTNSILDVRTMKVTDDTYYLHLFKVDVATGDTDVVLRGNDHLIRFITDGRGHVLGSIDRDQSLKDHYMVQGREVGAFDAAGGDRISITGVGPDGATLAALSYAEGDTLGLFDYQFGASSVGRPLFHDPVHDVTDYMIDDWTGHVGGVTWIDDRVEHKYFDPAIAHIQERISHALPGQSVAVLSRDQASANFVVEADGAKSPATYYLFNAPSGQLSLIGPSYPGLAAGDLGDVRPYTYKSADGTEIHAYLTLPPGKAPKNLPTVIFPHGGPAARDAQQFDYWAQFMASRGYAVLQPNFRGSDGYGARFRDAGDGQWNGKLLEDINGGLGQLVHDGISDPRKVCIVGASFGGYAALAAATFSPDLYACAASYAGPSDLDLSLSRTLREEGEHSQGLSVWEKRMGAHHDEAAKLEAESPADHANAVKAPILLMHSDKDITVNIEQSEREESALRSAGKSVQFVKFEGDDHYLLQTETRARLLKTLETFLATNIGN